jgi:hypothetical protein
MMVTGAVRCWHFSRSGAPDGYQKTGRLCSVPNDPEHRIALRQANQGPRRFRRDRKRLRVLDAADRSAAHRRGSLAGDNIDRVCRRSAAYRLDRGYGTTFPHLDLTDEETLTLLS